MRKLVKMSLVAAVAVAGLTTANAKSLVEAIKDVDVSGSVVYRYQDYNSDLVNGAENSTNNYKIGLSLSSKVNDDVKVYTRFIAGSNEDAGFASLDYVSKADGQASVTLSNVYFGYTGIKNTTVNIGKQGLTTPWTSAIDSDGNEQTGTGVLALSTWGPVTVAAAYFNQTNTNESGNVKLPTGSEDFATVGVLGKFGPVALDAWYLNIADIATSYTLGAKSSFKVGSVKLGLNARYTTLELENAAVANLVESGEDNSLLKVTVTAKVGIVNALYAYAMTDKDGGLTALDGQAATTVLFWNMNLVNKADADFHHFRLGVNVIDNLNISANFSTMDYMTGVREDNEQQAYAQFVYKMSKNLSTYIRYGTYERERGNTKNIDDKYRGRLQIQYSF